MPLAEVQPWERQDEESEQDYEAFKGYLLQTPPRRLAHSSVRHSTSELSKLYNDMHWRERVLAYDRHVQRQRQEEREALLKQDERERVAKAQAVLETMGDTVSREMAKLLRESEGTEMFGLVKPGDLVKFVDRWITLQRLIHGESTENVAVSDPRLEKLTPDELRELARLHAKMAAGEEVDD